MIWILFGFTMIISLVAAARVKSTFFASSQVPGGSGLTGAEAADRILRAAGINDVEIVQQDGLLSDHYDPSHKRLVLCTENFHGDNAAALGIAAHECGHAIQHKIAYGPLNMRMAAVGVTTYANQVVTWLPIVFMFTNIVSTHVGLLLMACGWGIIMLFNLITLPVEFDASRRAKIVLQQMSITRGDDANLAVKKVLDAAAWTYVAAFITSLLYMLYYLLPLLTGGNRRDE